MFKPLVKEDGKTLEVLATNGQTFTKFCGVKFTTGLAVVAAAGDPSIDFISTEAATIANTTTNITVLRVDPSILMEVDTSAAVAAANVGIRYDIANQTHIDVAATTDKAFLIAKLYPGNNTKAYGYFMQPIA